MKPNTYPIYIGIDPGTTTGFAIWDAECQSLISLETHTFFSALDRILDMKQKFNICVVVEDSTQRKWYGANAEVKRQGAGSIKRECKIWKEVLDGFKIPNKFCHPIKYGTKINQERFKQITGWNQRTNNHVRDAAMLVYKRV